MEHPDHIPDRILLEAPVQILRNAVVDIENCHSIVRRVLREQLGDERVAVVFACDRKTSLRHAAVDVAGHVLEAELLLAPALGGRTRKLEPVPEGLDRFFVCGKAADELLVIGDARGLLLHLRRDFRRPFGFLDALDFVLKVEQAELLDFDPDGIHGRQVVVAGLEVAWARPEKPDGRVLRALDDFCDREEMGDFLDPLLRADHRSLGDVDLAEKPPFARAKHGRQQAAERVTALLQER